MRPIVARYWQQHQTFDGTYTIDDLLAIHDLMDAEQAARKKANNV